MTWTDFKEYSSDVQLQIGQRIQKLRIDKKIAAVDLAAVLDIQSNQMSRIENGRANCTVGKMRRNGFSQRDVDRQWNQIVNMIRKKQISGVVVANMAAISSSVADAYFKVGLVIEAGGIVVTVDEGRLDMHIKKGA